MGAAASTLIAGGVAVGLVRAVQGLRDRNVLSSLTARKLMHTGALERGGGRCIGGASIILQSKHCLHHHHTREHHSHRNPHRSRRTTATGLVFMSLWPIFGGGASARYFAAAVPAALTAKFVAVGSGALRDDRLVASATVRYWFGADARWLDGPKECGCSAGGAARKCGAVFDPLLALHSNI